MSAHGRALLHVDMGMDMDVGQKHTCRNRLSLWSKCNVLLAPHVALVPTKSCDWTNLPKPALSSRSRSQWIASTSSSMRAPSFSLS